MEGITEESMKPLTKKDIEQVHFKPTDKDSIEREVTLVKTRAIVLDKVLGAKQWLLNELVLKSKGRPVGILDIGSLIDEAFDIEEDGKKIK